MSAAATRVALAAALLAAPAGCTLHRVDAEPLAPTAVPEAFSAPGGDAPRADRWWTDLGDPALADAIAVALGDNLDVRRAWARVDQAAAAARQARAGWLPQVDATASITRNRSNFFLSEPIGKVAVTNTVYNLSAAAAYEVDVWGKVREGVRAGRLEEAAARQDAEALAMTLAAQVAEAWYGLAAEQALLGLLAEQLRVGEQYQDLVAARFGQGLAGALDVRQQRQQVAALRAQVPLVEGRAAALRHQLALLQGQPPSAPIPLPGATLPEPPPLPAVGVPADLLQARPDVRAARLRVVAADHRVGAALADRFPTLRLSGSTGFQDRTLTDLFTSWIWNLAANLSATLFDGGRRKAEVDRARAVVEERLLGYGQVLLTALGEVEDALALESWQRAHLDALAAQLAEARLTLDEARARYGQGLIDYLPVLTALQGVQQAEQRLLAARRQLLSYRIQLYRALGGTWTADLARRPPDGDTP